MTFVNRYLALSCLEILAEVIRDGEFTSCWEQQSYKGMGIND
jgi:hypothetical protein